MVLFSNMFSKQTCKLCRKEVETLAIVKPRDETYICKECKKEFKALLKDKIARIVYQGYYGVVLLI